VSPPNIPVEITIDVPSIDPELAGLILIGIDGARGNGNIPTAGSVPRPDRGGERMFQGDVLIVLPGLPGLQQSDIYNPLYDFVTRPGLPGLDTSYLNRFRTYFSSASGGFGVRIGYDRRIRSDLRLTAGTEMLTYGYRRAADILGAQLPESVTRITLVSLPFGLQQQFGAGNRIIPHVGVAVGPVIRFDHRPGIAPGFYPSNTNIRTGQSGSSFGVTVNPFQDFPTISLTFGGFVETGADVRFGEDRDLSLTLAGRYAITRFYDSLGNPGDFSGMSFSVGFGKYF
jgi:hypothetical protein